MTYPVLSFDIGGTKIAWGCFDEKGEIKQQGRFDTPKTIEDFEKQVTTIAAQYPSQVISVAAPGIVDPKAKKIIVTPNIPYIRNIELKKIFPDHPTSALILDNDGRCALIAEAWKGAAQESSSTVMITLGTGIGGAVMQKGVVIPHPKDLTEEIGHIVAISQDPMQGPSIRGSIEALLGGRNIQLRFGEKLEEIASSFQKNDEEAQEIVMTLRYYFLESIRAIHSLYGCKQIIVGGGAADRLELFKDDETQFPCPVVMATTGSNASLIGAARLGLDMFETMKTDEESEWNFSAE